jgi:hypothetical protein
MNEFVGCLPARARVAGASASWPRHNSLQYLPRLYAGQVTLTSQYLRLIGYDFL